MSSSKLQDKCSAIFTPCRVEEFTEPGAREVVLYVAWIKMVKAMGFRAELNEAFAIPNKSAVRANAHLVSYERLDER